MCACGVLILRYNRNLRLSTMRLAESSANHLSKKYYAITTGRMMDELDRALVKALSANARASGSALAYRLGVAESTISHRIKKLHADGHIRGYHADVNIASLGVTLQALIAIRLVKHVRKDVDEFRDAAPQWPGVLSLFHMGGADDFLLHVAVRNAEDLRTFVLRHLASHPAVAHAETNIIFEHVDGLGVEHLLN